MNNDFFKEKKDKNKEVDKLVIKAEKVSFSFPEKELYSKINFSLEENKHCAFIGTNGTGKSTLIDIICNPDRYMYEGKMNVEEEIRIGHVNQFYNINRENEKTVFDYLAEDFVHVQDQINKVCDEMGTAEDIESVMEKYQQLLDYSNAIDADNYESNIKKKLKVAGLSQCENMLMTKLSGGEYKLVCIMKEMIITPDLLIMDEPDGFLDFDNLNSLKQLINTYKGTMLVITHNRFLLNSCFDKIWHLENTHLQEFDGNYINYNFTLLKAKAELMEQSIKDEEEIERNKAVVNKMRNLATKVDNASFGRQVHARATHLALLEARKIQAPFIDIRNPEIEFTTDNCFEADSIIEVRDYESGFNRVLMENVNFTIKPGDKVAIVGENGTGKSTLLRDIYLNEKNSIIVNENAVIEYLTQNVDTSFEEFDRVENLFEKVGIKDKEEMKSYLEKYCLSQEILNSKVSSLSGGEKNLLQLVKLAIGNANMLLLDEPTNHLDTYAQIALEKAINEFNGTVLMVSHDFYTIVNCTDYILLIEDKNIRQMSTRAFRKFIYKKYFDKDYLEYETKRKEKELKIMKALEKGDYKTAMSVLEEMNV